MTDSILAATRRLAGHLVATPVIGAVRLPGWALPAELRVKAECLQMGGTVMFRGYLHHLMRSLGRYKGVALWGTPRQLVAQALAASIHRLPGFAVAELQVPPPLRVMIEGCGHDLTVVDPGDGAAARLERARRTGFQPMPGLEDADVHDGVATIGVELADQLPCGVERVVVSPALLVGPVCAGLRAAGRELPVVGADAAGEDFGPLGQAVAQGLRLLSDPEGLAALAHECRFAASQPECGPACVILAS
jgi:threonine dehydratase